MLVKLTSSSLRRLGVVAGLVLGSAATSLGADALPERGPFWSGTVLRTRGLASAMKGVAVTLGAAKTNYVVYDLDTLRLSAAWSGEFLEFGNTLTKIEWPPPPNVTST